MKIPRRPHRVQYVSADDKITSFSGLKLVMDLAHQLGIVQDLSSLLTVKKRRRGIPIADFVMSLVSNFVIGGEHLSDLSQLRNEKATRALLYDLEVPAATTAGETLRKFTIGHIKQVERVIANALARTADQTNGSKPITLDVDSSIFEVHGYLKEGARYGYTRVNGYHPLLAFCAENRLLVGARLRSGNRHTAHKVRSFLEECVRRLPSDHRVNGRFDAGFYNREVAEFCLEKSMGFTISAKLFAGLIERANAISDEDWKPYPWEEDAEWVEFSYQPAGWSRSFRMLIKRAPFYEGNQLVVGRYFYTPVITNRPGAGSSLIRFHLARGGMENYIEEFKNGIGARIMPTGRFMANWAWLVIAQLAYNLVQWFKLLALPASERSFQMKRLRLHWFHVAARVIRSGRKVTLALARGPDAATRFELAQRAVALA